MKQFLKYMLAYWILFGGIMMALVGAFTAIFSWTPRERVIGLITIVVSLSPLLVSRRKGLVWAAKQFERGDK